MEALANRFLRSAALVVLPVCVAASACGASTQAGGGLDASPDSFAEVGGDVELSSLPDAPPPSSSSGSAPCQSTCGVVASGASSGPYVCDPHGVCVECVEDSACASAFPGWKPVCLPSEKCGCTQNSQCASSKPRCAPGSSQCGCSSNADCHGLAYPGPLCDLNSGNCVLCLTNADCTDPDEAACVADACVPCATSQDCAAAGDGPTCTMGNCSCARDSDCAGRGAGPSCVADTYGNAGYSKCGCSTATDCATSSDGHVCMLWGPLVLFGKGAWMQCGCRSDADCAPGMTCSGLAPSVATSRCRPARADAGVSDGAARDGPSD